METPLESQKQGIPWSKVESQKLDSEVESQKQGTRSMRLKMGDENRQAGSGMLELEDLKRKQQRVKKNLE